MLGGVSDTLEVRVRIQNDLEKLEEMVLIKFIKDGYT